MEPLYIEIMVWKRLSDSRALRFVCFNDLTSNEYAVQSADFFKLPVDAKQIEYFAKQCVELFIETSPTARCEWFGSLNEAIAAHERDFAG